MLLRISVLADLCLGLRMCSHQQQSGEICESQKDKNNYTCQQVMFSHTCASQFDWLFSALEQITDCSHPGGFSFHYLKSYFSLSFTGRKVGIFLYFSTTCQHFINDSKFYKKTSFRVRGMLRASAIWFRTKYMWLKQKWRNFAAANNAQIKKHKQPGTAR